MNMSMSVAWMHNPSYLYQLNARDMILIFFVVSCAHNSMTQEASPSWCKPWETLTSSGDTVKKHITAIIE